MLLDRNKPDYTVLVKLTFLATEPEIERESENFNSYSLNCARLPSVQAALRRTT